ncbi:hypothetical protein RRG08_037343 [Elysia crispata]|uniref:Uncharacterized protein n=1 Tax=Elysia crispata TaxID=231223 RepID=A0AAE1AAF0_9GAST|nr:hypothetical protein RRG08_017049 [Elysia crispata]KAK3784265.1 hypothetical protein RRG08_037343 [Elysia crispata]
MFAPKNVACAANMNPLGKLEGNESSQGLHSMRPLEMKIVYISGPFHTISSKKPCSTRSTLQNVIALIKTVMVFTK